MGWPDHHCTFYCQPEAGLHCEVLRFWVDGANPTQELTPGDYAGDLRRRHGIELVRWEPAREAPPIRPDEPPIGRITGQPMRHVRTWLVWYREAFGR